MYIGGKQSWFTAKYDNIAKTKIIAIQNLQDIQFFRYINEQADKVEIKTTALHEIILAGRPPAKTNNESINQIEGKKIANINNIGI